MKLNQKGFMMAEVIIVSAVLITTMVSLYAGFNKVYSDFNERSTYYNTDGIYALKNIENFLVDEGILNQLVRELKNIDQIDLSTCDNETYYKTPYAKTLCSQIKEQYNINKIIITKYNKETLTKIITTPTYNETLQDYINYISNNEEFDQNQNTYNYILIGETIPNKKEETEENYIYNYANLRIK